MDPRAVGHHVDLDEANARQVRAPSKRQEKYVDIVFAGRDQRKSNPHEADCAEKHGGHEFASEDPSKFCP